MVITLYKDKDLNKKFNTKQKAIALNYDPAKLAPTILAKGQGYVAQKLMEKAKQYDIPVYKDEKLVEELNKINIGDNIPPELYEIVAQVLLFVGDLDKLQEKMNVK